MSITQEAKDIIKEALDTNRDILILSGIMNFRSVTENIVRGLADNYIRTYGAVLFYDKSYDEQVDNKILEDAIIKLTEDKITALVKVSNQEIDSIKLYKKVMQFRGEIYNNIIITAVNFGRSVDGILSIKNQIANDFINMYNPLILVMDRETGVKIELKIYEGNKIIHEEGIHKLILADSNLGGEYDG